MHESQEIKQKLIKLQNSSNAILAFAMAIKNLLLYTSNFILIIPCQFLASFNVSRCKESNPWKAEIVCIDKDILNVEIRLAGMLKKY